MSGGITDSTVSLSISVALVVLGVCCGSSLTKDGCTKYTLPVTPWMASVPWLTRATITPGENGGSGLSAHSFRVGDFQNTLVPGGCLRSSGCAIPATCDGVWPLRDGIGWLLIMDGMTVWTKTVMTSFVTFKSGDPNRNPSECL